MTLWLSTFAVTCVTLENRPETDLYLLVLLERAYERENHMDPGLLSLLL
jgi:hypothetical protein